MPRRNPRTTTTTTTRPAYHRVIDLHDPSMDATGRVDVLVARSVKRVVEVTQDPVIGLWYTQLQPKLDGVIHSLFGKFNVSHTLKSMGIANPLPDSKRVPRKRAPRPRRGEVL